MAINEILIRLIGLVISIPLSALLLMLSTKIFKLKDTSYKTAIKITAIVIVLAFLFNILLLTIFPAITLNMAMFLLARFILGLIFNVILMILLIKSFYEIKLGKTLLVWLVWLAISLILALIMRFIIGVIAILLIGA